jgi:TRAP transporter 4TM/12TM fusion protein
LISKQGGTFVEIPKNAETDLLAKYEAEYRYRRLVPWLSRIITVLCLIWATGQIYTAAFGVFPSTLQRAPHVGFAMVLIYMLYPMRSGQRQTTVPWYDWIFVALSVSVTLYHVVFYEDLINRAGVYSGVDTYVSVVAVALILEAARRIAGLVITSLAMIFLLYAYLGSYLPGFIAHPGFSIERISTFQWLSTEGILGIPVDVSATFIFLFLLFASFLKKTGIGDWLTGVAVGLTGGAVGGPAKAAVISSALQGTISGSSVANVVGTGSVTIPLMKSIGYRPEFAAAVEAAASTGGQLMPPIMGAAAFVMSEFLNVPYYKIAAAAAIPALLYFTGIFFTVHLEALRTGLKGIPKENLPNWRQLIRTRWFLSIPIFGIVVVLALGFTAMKAALIGLGLTIIAGAITKEGRLGLAKIVEAVEDGSRSALPVAIACATAGIIVGVVTLSGLGLKMSGGLVELAGGNIYLTMFLTMIGSLVLGMGVPTTANYIIQATVSAPALVLVGVNPIAAHLFVFYFGIVADITPPVALAAFAGSGIANSNPLKTGFEATKLGIAAFLVPYVFALSPVLVLVNVTVISLTQALATALIGMLGIAAGTTGFLVARLAWYERVIIFLGGVFLIVPGTVTDISGLAAVVGIYLLKRWQNKKHSMVVK